MIVGKYGLEQYLYEGADGRPTVRPPGLGDSPGAACWAGSFVAAVGLAYLGLPVSFARKLLGILMGMAGVVVIFLTHVRASLVITAGCGVIYAMMMVGQRRMRTAAMLVIGMALGGACSLSYAVSMGGTSTLDRFTTLISDDPGKVYEKSARLEMVTDAFDTLLIEHPLGAGLGRWGMMRAYFGDETNVASPEIWAEVQFPAWILDGGVVLLSLYLSALAVAILRLIKLSLLAPSALLRSWGAAIVMLSAGPLALMFSFVPFHSQLGMQFWLLIGAFEGLAQGESATLFVPTGAGQVGNPPWPTSPRNASAWRTSSAGSWSSRVGSGWAGGWRSSSGSTCARPRPAPSPPAGSGPCSCTPSPCPAG
jgi:hypothetical protein